MVVLLTGLDLQTTWLAENLVRPLAKSAGSTAQVVFYDGSADLGSMLKLDRDGDINRVGLVLLDRSDMQRYADKSRLRPLDAARAETDLRPHLAIAREGAEVSGDAYGLPHSVDVPVMVYRRSKVEAAVRDWERLRPQLDALFQPWNGRGLPADYRLPPDPSQWNSYDLAVVAYTWAHTPEDGVMAPRVAHRGYDGPETALDLYAAIYALGGRADDVLAGDTQPDLDAFTWEAFLAHSGLYPAAMWSDGWGMGGLWEALRDGQVYLTFMTPAEVALLHGGSVKDAPALMRDAGDLATARLPRGVSLELDAQGAPARVGDGAAPAALTYWAIPKSTPDGARSYALAAALASDRAQAKEAASFAVIPTRQDALDAVSALPAEGWVRDLVAVGSQQAQLSRPLPIDRNDALVAAEYVRAWRELVEGRAPLGSGALAPAALRGWLATHAQAIRTLVH